MFFFSKEVIRPDRSKLEETEKAHTPKNPKYLRSFLVFTIYVKRFIPNCSTFRYNHTYLKKTLPKEVAFDWT